MTEKELLEIKRDAYTAYNANSRLSDEVPCLIAEVLTLQDENARLRAALTTIASDESVWPRDLRRHQDVARAVLAAADDMSQKPENCDTSAEHVSADNMADDPKGPADEHVERGT